MASAWFLLLVVSGVAFAADPVPSTEPKQAQQVTVTVYFESFCPDSVKFLSKQLYPVTLIPAIMSQLNIVLVPYGKAKMEKIETGYNFTCHHGDKECHGNKVLACMLNTQDANNEEKFAFTNCTSTIIGINTNLEKYPTAECASKNLMPADLEQCAQDKSRGSEYLAKFGNITLQQASEMGLTELNTVPTIVFNNKFMEMEHKLALTDFKQAVCNKLSTKPTECPTGNAATTLQLQAAILPLCAAVALASRA